MDKETQKAYSHRYYLDNKEKILAYSKMWRKKNPEKVKSQRRRWLIENKDRMRQWRKEHRKKNPEKVKISKKRYYENHKKMISLQGEEWQEEYKAKHRLQRRNYYNEVLKHRPQHMLSKNMRRSIGDGLCGRKNRRTWYSLVGYTLEDLKKHLEKQFDENMSWDNYGKYWHVDHIRPQSSFNYVLPTDDDFIKCWALENLQPLEAMENQRKYNKWL